MKKIIGIFIGMCLIIIMGYWLIIGVVVNFVGNAIVDEKDNTKALKEELIGERILINNDTLIITEFTYIGGIEGQFTNGKPLTINVSVEFAKKNLIKE